MISNLIESWNFVFKETRNLPIIALVQSIYCRLGFLFAERAHSAFVMAGFGDAFTKHCMDALKEEVGKSNIHQVDQFDRERFTFYVWESINYRDGRPMRTFKLDLQAGRCGCAEF